MKRNAGGKIETGYDILIKIGGDYLSDEREKEKWRQNEKDREKEIHKETDRVVEYVTDCE